ncbi:MAG: adenylate/guanylate cyclase domain-containing protein [Betaproteobacteria bacterium]|nr:adenylate/guanylate cyclase domain-containing protein [Betaproteobacteria bacterium]
MQRRLAAIVSADVQGYSRLMGDDEAATVRTLTAYRDLMVSLIREHGGRVVDSPGDNLLAEFPSVVDALHSAAAIQKALAVRNELLPPGRRMEFRIGINLGDVIAEGERIYGDGVNIAARVQDLAEAGGICISGTTYDQVENKVALHYEFIGEHAAKNIAKPVRAYRVGLSPATETAVKSGQGLTPPGIPSIAVLPFDNMSADPDQEYFSDGIVEDLITDLSKLSGLFVIARNSTFSYKGKAVRVQQVGRELGVRYVLEGSVRKVGDHVRITGQLIDASSGRHLWADRYDRRLDDVFAVQDEITRRIVDALAITLTRGEQQQRERRRTDLPEAYDCLLRGIDYLQRTTSESNIAARRMLEKAVDLDPKFAEAYALLSHTYHRDWTMGWSQERQTLERAFEFAERAIALDDLLPAAYRALATALLWQRAHDKAIIVAQRAVDLAPSDAHSHFILGEVLSWSHPEKAIVPVQKAMRLNPHYPPSYSYTLGHVHFLMRRYDDALAELNRVVSRNPDWLPAHGFLAATYAELGRFEQAQQAMREAERISPAVLAKPFIERLPYEDPTVLARVFDAFRAAGLAPPSQ